MIINVSDISRTNRFLSFFGEGSIPEKKDVDRKSVEDKSVSLITIIDILLKAENFHLKKNLDLRGGKLFLAPGMEKRIEFIVEFLKNFNTSILKLSKTERQTFVFVLENIGEYFQNLSSCRSKKEKESLFDDFTFWFDNFIKFFEQKINGEVEIVTADGKSDIDIIFKLKSSILPLYPIVLHSKNQILFLKEVKEEGVVYGDIKDKVSTVIDGRDAVEKVLEFLYANFSLQTAELIVKYPKYSGSNSHSGVMGAIIANSEGRYKESLDRLRMLPESLKKLPRFQLLAMDNLEKTGHIMALKEVVEKFIRDYPLYFQGYEMRGRLNENDNKINLAISDYGKVLGMVNNRELSEKVKKLKNLSHRNRERNESENSVGKGIFIDILSSEIVNEAAIIHRNNEIRQMIEILISDSGNNLLVLGESGVGKTTLIRMLARRLEKVDIPDILKNRKIMEINFVSLLIGTKYRGQFEEKVVKLLEEFKDGNDILLLEDIHLMMSQGVSRGTTLDLINILKQFLKERSIQVIATTSYNEYKNSLERDSSFLSYFQKLNIKEMTGSETELILKKRAKITVEKDNIIVPDDIVEVIVENSRKSLPGKRLPDAALIMFDRCISKVKLKSEELREPIFKLSYEVVAEVISDLLNLPESDLSFSVKERLSKLELNIKKEIIGQDSAVKRLVSGIISSKLGYDVKGNRPDGVFLFVGPTGVGKSETALVLAKYLLGSRESVIRIDMSEYMERFTYSRFVGAAPGYVGYNDATQLTDKIRQNPYSVILLDEIEKADYQLLNIFLQVFDAGRMTDARGNEVDFSHSTIIMTSNIGTSLYSKPKMGYNYPDNGEDVTVSALQRSLKSYFSPEFLNRIDDIIVFNSLKMADIENIIDLQLENTVQKLRKEGKKLIVPDEVKSFIVRMGYSKEFGARNISRTIKKRVLEKIAFMSLDNRWDKFDTLECMVSDDIEIKFGLSGAGHEEIVEALQTENSVKKERNS